MATFSIPLQQRAFSFGNFSTKQKHAPSTLQDLHLPIQIRCSCKYILFFNYSVEVDVGFFLDFVTENKYLMFKFVNLLYEICMQLQGMVLNLWKVCPSLRNLGM